MPDIIKPLDQTPEAVSAPITLPTKIPGADTSIFPENVILFQEEMNRTMGHLLMMRSSLDTHRWKQVSDFKMALHQNEAGATEAIREAKAHCGATIGKVEAHHNTHIRKAKAHHATLIREAEANCTSNVGEAEAICTSIIMEAEAHCTADVRKVESCCAEHAHSIQQLHTECMQHLEMEAMEEEGRDCLSFPSHLWNGTAGLPPEAHG